MVFSRKLVSNNPNSILIPLFHHFLVKYFFYLLSYRPVQASSQVHQILESLFQCFCWSSSYFSRWNPMQISPFLLIHQHVGGHKFDWKSPSIHIYPSFFHHFSTIFPIFHHFPTIFPAFFSTSPGSLRAVSGTPRPPTWPKSPRPWAAAGTAQPRAARCGSPNWRRLGDFLGVLVGISNGISGNFSGIQWDWVELSGAHMSSCVYCWGQVISSGKLSHNSHNYGKIHHFVMGK